MSTTPSTSTDLGRIGPRRCGPVARWATLEGMTDGPVLRIGDRERHAADEQLRAAVGDGVLTLEEYGERAAELWQARTKAELDALVGDLPSAQPVPAALPVPPGQAPPARRIVAVLSEDRLECTVAPGQRVQAVAVLGTARVDLRRDDLPEQVHVTATAVLGEVEVLVPRGAAVQLSGLAVLGERSIKVTSGAGPVIHLDAYAALGTVTVKHGKNNQSDRSGASSGQVVRSAPHEVESGRRSGIGRLRQALGSLAVAGVLAAGAVGLVAAGPDGRVLFGSSTVGAQPGDEVQVSMLFGSMIVIVPDDARVQTSGTVVFGSVNCEQACRGEGTGEVIVVRAIGGFGSVGVLTVTEAQREGDGPGP